MLISSAAMLACGCAHSNSSPTTHSSPATTRAASTQPTWDGPIIDIHQHTKYGRPNVEALLHHQKRMGVTQTILLPSGSPADTPATMKGKANGLYAGAGPQDTVVPVAREHPGQYFFFANEVPDLPNARKTIEKWLNAGALGIGELKYSLQIDGPEMEMIYNLANDHRVPVLMHFQYDFFNLGYERFGKILAKWPNVNFIGHAQLFWAHIDKNCDPKIN